MRYGNEIFRYVLDSSAFINAETLPEGELFSTPLVRSEVKDFKSLMLFQTRDVNTVTPDRRHISKVKSKALETGDFTKLSSADISVLALAHQVGAVIVTDDYNIQNVAEEMGMKYKSVSVPEIKEVFKRVLYCDRCRRKRTGEKCPLCGGALRLKVVK